MASRHMYWMASWSPSQSLPLTVSYACHRQSSLVMFPSAALMPPWAATVCDRVGNSFVMHAVLNPFSVSPTAARRPAPPAPTTTQSYVWSTMSYDDDSPPPSTARAGADECSDRR